MEEKKSSTGIVVLITVLIMLVLGLSGFIIYDKVLNKTKEPIVEEDNTKEENNESVAKEISVNSDLVTNLVYPRNAYDPMYETTWIYKNETFDTLGRTIRMQDAASRIEADQDDKTNTEWYYKESSVEESYKKIYGPDANYVNGSLEKAEYLCGFIADYNSSKKMYIAGYGCGGETSKHIDYITKTYKAEQKDDDLYVYAYVQPVIMRPEDTVNYSGDTVIFLLDHNNKEIKQIDYNNYKNIIYDMMNNGEVSTYKWTFKKQSDGKYYFYSGEWEK